MHAVRRTLAAAAAAVLIVGLSACGDTEEEPTAGETVTEAESETDPETDSDTESENDAEPDSESDAETDEESDTETESETDSGTESDTEDPADEPGTTAVDHLWVDDSWTIEEVEDLCGDMDLFPSQYSDQEGSFTCGPTAASALACRVGADDLVLCITNASDRMALSFTSERAVSDAPAMPANEDALPLQVTLPEDVTCEPLSHDHGEHFEDSFSWYACDDGSELLTDEDIANTFTVEGDAWTVQRSIDQGAPEEVVAERVTFAGTE